MRLLHGPGGRALAHTTKPMADRVLWWSLIVVAALGVAVFVALLAVVLWGTFVGVPETP